MPWSNMFANLSLQIEDINKTRKKSNMRFRKKKMKIILFNQIPRLLK